jgi:serine/threonine-protein kinase RsbW/stage II sporulation protein AB (anti-sigma F factor)
VERRRDDIRLVMTEAATNAVWHAYRDGDPGPLYVGARLMDWSLIVAVVDRGRWLSPRADGPGLGLGLSLMSQLSDDLLISHDAGGVGTCVRATFEGATAATGRRTAGPAAGDRGEMMREYLQLLTATHASLHEDTRAILAQAERAVAHARQQQRARARRR